MELVDYLRILRNHWIAVAAMLAISALGAFTYSSLQPPVYAATSSGFVTATTDASSDVNLNNINDLLSKSRAASYVGLAEDQETASIVIDNLNLDTPPEILVDNVDVDQVPGTVLINVTARSATPQGAQELADAWMSALADRVSEIESVSEEPGVRIEAPDSALLPTDPISPRTWRNVLLSVILASLLGAGYAVVRTLLDRRLRSSADVRRAGGVSVVASVPELSQANGFFITAGRGDDSSQPAEEVRRMRINLSHIDPSHQPRSIVVTSPNPGDGKTTIAVNLAGAMALTGQPVTLIDADLRDSGLTHFRGGDSAIGLTDVLGGDAELDVALQPDPEIVGLSVLTTGTRSSRPSELLDSAAMSMLVEKLAGRGMVIIDAPAILPVADASIMAQFADGVLVVVRAGSTLDTDLRTAIDHLLAVRARPLGVVLNRAMRRTPPRRTLAKKRSSARESVASNGTVSEPPSDMQRITSRPAG